MKIIAVLLLSLATLSLPAQDIWNVRFRGRTRMIARTEDTARNFVEIRKGELSKSTLEVIYKQVTPTAGFSRSIMLYTATDSLLWQKDATAIKLTEGDLRKWMKKQPVIYIYTVSIPADPKMKEAVRVRRVHLCTIRFV